MRNIKLPATKTIIFSLSKDEIDSGGIIMPDGLIHKSMGAIDAKSHEELETARSNGGAVLWATSCLEQSLERIIVNYFMGPFEGPSHKRQLFENEVIKSSSFPFSFKKLIIQNISDSTSVIGGKDRSKLQSGLKKIMLWRNAFAHGQLKLDSKQGVILCYYSSGHQQKILSDAFWSELEATFEVCSELAKKLEDGTN